MDSIPADEPLHPLVELRDNGQWWASHSLVGVGIGKTEEEARRKFIELEAAARNPVRPTRRFTSVRHSYVIEDELGTRQLLRSLGYPEHTSAWRVELPGSGIEGDGVTESWRDWSVELIGAIVKSPDVPGVIYTNSMNDEVRWRLQAWIRRVYSTYCPLYIEAVRHPERPEEDERISLHRVDAVEDATEVGRLFEEGRRLLKTVERQAGRPKGSGYYPNRIVWVRDCWDALHKLQEDDNIIRPPSDAELYSKIGIASSTYYEAKKRWGLPWE